MLPKIDELVLKLEKFGENIGSDNFKVFLIKEYPRFPEFKAKSVEDYFESLYEFYKIHGKTLGSIILKFKGDVYYVIERDLEGKIWWITAPIEFLSKYSPENYIRIKRAKEYKIDLIYY